MSVRGFAEHLGVAIRTVSMWESSGQARVPRPVMQAALDTVLTSATSEDRQRFEQLIHEGSSSNDTLVRRSLDGELDRQAVNADAMEAVRFARRIGASVITANTLDQINVDVSRLAIDYVSHPLSELFSDIRELRNHLFDLIETNRHPGQSRRLYMEACRLEGMQAHICFDMGHYRAAQAHAQTAQLCAEHADHRPLGAWTFGLQSLISYWSGDLREAAIYARRGAEISTQGSLRARLAGLEARTAGLLGDKKQALAAIATADAEREDIGPVEEEHEVGIFYFPQAKQETYAGTALLALGDQPSAILAAGHSSRALDLYQSAAPADQSSGDILAARLDLATAHLLRDDLDAVSIQLDKVLSTPQIRRTASIVKRARGVAARLGGIRYASSAYGRCARSELLGFCEPSPALPPGTMDAE